MNMFNFSWFMGGALVIMVALIILLVISGFMTQPSNSALEKLNNPFFVEVQPIQP